MPSREFLTHSSEETIALGRELATELRPPVLLCLDGELGAGKTTLAKGIISGLGVAREEDVTSPTFTLVHVFKNGVRVFHVDLYRVADRHDLETLGLEDLFAEPAIVLVEWPERLALRTDWPIVQVRLEHGEGDTRRIRVTNSAGALAALVP
jgi:tRNA threonylcarbamoyladenosine biosynthesis protein TsaE